MTILSTKQKLVISRYLLTLPSYTSSASHMVLSRKLLKRVGESTHPRSLGLVIQIFNYSYDVGIDVVFPHSCS